MATQVYGNGVNSSAGENTVKHFYDRAGIKAANEINVYQQWASKKEMPLNMGKTYKISKFLHMYDRRPDDAEFQAHGYLTARSLSAVQSELTTQVALGEGAGAVNQKGIQKVTVETSFARYGEMIEYTDEVDMFSEDIMQVRYREELGRLANRRMEDLIQLDMLATGNKLYSGGVLQISDMGTGLNANGSEDNTYRVSYDLIRLAARKLVRNRSEKNTEIVSGTVKIDTKTINKAFYAIIGPEIKYDLENTVRGTGNEAEFTFIPVYKYVGATTLAEGEVGAMHDVRFIESESALVRRGAGAAIPANYEGSLSHTNVGGTNKFDVFPMLFPTKGAFATVGLKGQGKIKFNSQSPEQVSIVNPYGTKGFFSYNFWYAGIILDETRLLEVDVLATA